MVTYEAGQSLVEYNVMAYGNGETPGLTSLFWAANRDPGIQSVYLQYIDVLQQAGLIGVHPMVHFSSAGLWTKYGSWGAIEYTGQPIGNSPKYLALRSLFANASSSGSSGSAGLYVGNAFTFGLGLDVSDFSYAGFPAVLSPRDGDVWVTGPSSPHAVRWDTTGCDPQLVVSIYLWRINGNTNTNAAAAAALAVPGPIGSPTRVQHCLGQAVHTLPSSLAVNGSAQFFYEIRDATGGGAASNYSSIFALKSPFAFAPDISHACCQGDLYPVVVSAAPPVPTCYAAAGQEYSNALQGNSAWTSTATYLRLLNSPPSLTCSASAAGSAAWASYRCVLDASNGCRSYWVTLKTNSDIPGDRNKPIVDCVAQVSPFPRLNASSAAWAVNLPQVNVPYVTPTTSSDCFATNRTDYAVQRGACSAATSDAVCSTLLAAAPSFRPTHKPIVPGPHLVVQVSSAVLTQVLSPDWDKDGCPLKTNSTKYFLKVELSVTNIGGSEFSPSPDTVRSVNCRKSDAVVGFFQLSFPGGPYSKDAVCLSDSSHSCDSMGLSPNGGVYSSTVYFHLANSAAVATYPNSTYPAVIVVVTEGGGGVRSDPSVPLLTSMALH